MLSGFPPIESPSSSILILGTGPSIASLARQQYYGHERNAFWPIMSKLLTSSIETYEQKRTLLLEHDIAIWDVLSSFEREGSSDSAYTTVTANPLRKFIEEHKQLTRILFNGTKAAQLYKHLVSYYPQLLVFQVLPSTSPANTLRFEAKLEAWKAGLAQ